MVAPHVRLSQSAEYRENYIVQGNVLWCRFCNLEVEHKRKDSIDKHLHTAKHLKNKTTNNSNLSIQRTLPSFENTISEKERVNIDVVAAFTSADIPLEKIEKLKPFLLKYCKNGMKFVIFKYGFLLYLIYLTKLFTYNYLHFCRRLNYWGKSTS